MAGSWYSARGGSLSARRGGRRWTCICLTVSRSFRAGCAGQQLSRVIPPRGSPFGWNPLGSTPWRARACRTSAEIPAGRWATARLAARQVRRRHWITVIRPTGAPQNRSTTDRRECAGCGPLLPPPWIALRRAPVRARLGRPAAQRARRAHRAAGPVGTIRCARRDRGARPGRARGLPAHPDCESPGSGDTG